MLHGVNMEEPPREQDPARILHTRTGRMSAVLGAVKLRVAPGSPTSPPKAGKEAEEA